MKVKFYPGESKLQAVKFVKEFFDLPLKEAKDACDLGEIDVETSQLDTFNESLKRLGGFVENLIPQTKTKNEHFQVKIGEICRIGALSFVITEIHATTEKNIINLHYRGTLV
jgi:hypothetical protein